MGMARLTLKKEGRASRSACAPCPVHSRLAARNGLLSRSRLGSNVAIGGVGSSGIGVRSSGVGGVGGSSVDRGGVFGDRLDRSDFFNHGGVFDRRFFSGVAASGKSEQSGGREGSQSNLLHISFSKSGSDPTGLASRERPSNSGKNKAAQAALFHSSVRTSTVSPTRKNSTNGAQAASSGG